MRGDLLVRSAGIAYPGLPVLADLYREFVENGGEVWLCGACTKPRGIGEESVAQGARIVGAAKVVEEIVAGARSVSFA
jgi:predicted peroxiredoxin